MTSSHQHRGKPSGESRSKAKVSAAKIKCSFCGNTFYAAPKEAVCPKCDCPANRDLKPLHRAASLLVPPFGLIYGLMIRPHSPVAGTQSWIFAAIGALIYGGIYGAKSLF